MRLWEEGFARYPAKADSDWLNTFLV